MAWEYLTWRIINIDSFDFKSTTRNSSIWNSMGRGYLMRTTSCKKSKSSWCSQNKWCKCACCIRTCQNVLGRNENWKGMSVVWVSFKTWSWLWRHLDLLLQIHDWSWLRKGSLNLKRCWSSWTKAWRTMDFNLKIDRELEAFIKRNST